MHKYKDGDLVKANWGQVYTIVGEPDLHGMAHLTYTVDGDTHKATWNVKAMELVPELPTKPAIQYPHRYLSTDGTLHVYPNNTCVAFVNLAGATWQDIKTGAPIVWDDQ